MAGLALGSALCARRTLASPLRAYAIVEAAIAGAALSTLPLLRGLPRLYAAAEPLRLLTGPLDVLARALAASLVLLPATLLLGATVPLAVGAMTRHGRDLHQTFGRLYFLNTLGGALGTALGPFVLLPALGVTGTFLAAAFVNLLIGGVAWRASLLPGDRDAAVPARAVGREPSTASGWHPF